MSLNIRNPEAEKLAEAVAAMTEETITQAVTEALRDRLETLKRRSFNEAIEKAEFCLMSAASFVEASIVLEARKGYEGVKNFDLFVACAGIKVAEVDAERVTST